MSENRIVTIGECRRRGFLLLIGCEFCGREGYFWAGQLRLPDDLPADDAAWHLVCSNCGRRNSRNWPNYPIWCRGDNRNPSRGQNLLLYPPQIRHPGRTWREQEAYLKLPINAWQIPPDWRRTE